MNTTGRPAGGLIAELRRRFNWPLIWLLAAIALIRPLFSIVGWSEDLGKPATPLILTAAITLAWILIAGLGRVREPVQTLILAGLAYGLATIILSGILSPILDGDLEGPLANPIAIIPLFLVNAMWGAFCGVCALGLQRLRGSGR